jgi:hypothetical protein
MGLMARIARIGNTMVKAVTTHKGNPSTHIAHIDSSGESTFRSPPMWSPVACPMV